jgi:hypothetical protein
MNFEKTIDTLIRQLQDETPNCGGTYHFTRIDVSNEGKDTTERLSDYLKKIDAYKNPYVIDPKCGTPKPVADRDVKNLTLKPIANFLTVLDEKMTYWSNHQSSLDCRDKITDQYSFKLKEFKNALETFLNSKKDLKFYEIKGIDTYFSFGKDHVNDDLLIESEMDLYVLHFGWSS